MKKMTDKELIHELKIRFDENNNLMNELLEVNKQLRESETMKSHFISNITNELINPISSILGLSRHLVNLENNDCDKIVNFSRLIYEETFEVDFQMRNIFAAAKLEAGEFDLQVSLVKVIDLVKSVISLYENQAAKKNIRIQFFYEKKTLDNSDFFKTDSDKLQLIVSNLLSNSVKFAYENSIILIAVIIADGDVIISIKDNGIGIEENDMNIIFDRFSRINKSINSENKGLGLGLSVIRDTIELLHGSIKPVRLEEGIEFIIDVPECKTDEEIKEFSLDGNEFFFDEDGGIF